MTKPCPTCGHRILAHYLQCVRCEINKVPLKK